MTEHRCTATHPCECLCGIAAYRVLVADGVGPDTAIEALERARAQGLNLDKFAEFALTVRRLAEKSEGNREALRLAGNSAAFDALVEQFHASPDAR